MKDIIKPTEAGLYYINWRNRALPTRLECNKLIEGLKHLMEHYRHCLNEPHYPARVCTKLRGAIEDSIKTARELEGRLEKLLKEAGEFEAEFLGAEGFKEFLDLVDELVRLGDELSKLTENALKLLVNKGGG